jgi:hypothetical protein
MFSLSRLMLRTMVSGMESVLYDGEKSTLTVAGDINPVVVVGALREREHPATIITVGPKENLDQSNYITVHEQESESCTIM